MSLARAIAARGGTSARARERRIEWRFDGTWDGQSAGTDAATTHLPSHPLRKAHAASTKKKTFWLLDEWWTGETALDARWRRGSRSAAAQQQCRRLHHQEEEKQHPSGSRGHIGSAEAAVVAGLAALATAAAEARSRALGLARRFDADIESEN